MPEESIALFDEAGDVAIQGYGCDRRVFYWNDASEAVYGFRRAEALGARLEDLIIPPAMREMVVRETDAWMRGGLPPVGGPITLQRRDGSPVRVHSNHLMLRGGTQEPRMFCIDVPPERDAAVKTAAQGIGGRGRPAARAARTVLAGLRQDLATPVPAIRDVGIALLQRLDAPGAVFCAPDVPRPIASDLAVTRALAVLGDAASALTQAPRAMEVQDLLVQVALILATAPGDVYPSPVTLPATPSALRVRVDSFLATQALAALTSHALAVADERGAVTLSAHLHRGVRDMVMVCVEYPGPPLAPAASARALVGRAGPENRAGDGAGAVPLELQVAQRMATAAGALVSLDRTADGLNRAVLGLAAEVGAGA